MNPSVFCPFCNSPVIVPASGDNIRVGCPRCGESFAYQAGQFRGAATLPPMPATDEAASLPIHPRRSNRLVAAAIVGLMLCVAGIALAFALSTHAFRERNHYGKGNAPPPAILPSAHTPATLPGIGYLPLDTNLMAGVHVADLLKEPTAAKLLATPRPAPLELGLSVVEKWTGLKLEDLDHVVFGTTLNASIPQLTVVAVTRAPYNPGTILRAQHPHRPAQYLQKPLFRFKLEPVGEGQMWCADEHTLVLLLRPDAAKVEDLAEIPNRPRRGLEGLSPSVRELLEEQLAKDAVVWVAGHLEKAGPVKTLLGLSPLAKETRDAVSGVQAFSLALSAQGDATLSGVVLSAGPDQRRTMQTFLERQTWPGLKVVADEAHGAVQWQVRASPEQVRELLDSGKQLVPRLGGQLKRTGGGEAR